MFTSAITTAKNSTMIISTHVILYKDKWCQLVWQSALIYLCFLLCQSVLVCSFEFIMAVHFCYHQNYPEIHCNYFGRSYLIWSIIKPKKFCNCGGAWHLQHLGFLMNHLKLVNLIPDQFDQLHFVNSTVCYYYCYCGYFLLYSSVLFTESFFGEKYQLVHKQCFKEVRA